MKIDLHTHSTASDGQYTPTELIMRAAQKELKLFAITDHDTVCGLSEAMQAACSLNVPFVPGIEISTQQGEEIHIVGLGIDFNSELLQTKCEQFMTERMQRGDRIVAYLQGKGIDITLDEVEKFSNDGSLGRPHFARFLCEHGYVHSNQEAFDRYLNTTEFHKKTDRVKPTPQEAIALIHAAGGKAVLAHPGLLKMGKVWQETLIHQLAEAGLDALECYYFKHTPKQVKFYRKLALQNSLAISCGSDFHGEKVKPDVPFGMKMTEHTDLLLSFELNSFCFFPHNGAE